MKIGIPALTDEGLGSQVSGHFGRAPYFVIVDTDLKSVDIISNDNPAHSEGGHKKHEHHHEHGHSHGHHHGHAFRLISLKNLDVMICSGIGRRAIMNFKGSGIKVYSGATGTVEETIKSFENGSLKEANEENGCDHHH